MESTTVEEIRKHTWVYLTVFGGLAMLTVLTVAVASLEMAVGLGVTVAMIIAALKGSLVASFFMHLISEKRVILVILIFTFIFFVLLIAFPLSDFLDNAGKPNVPYSISHFFHFCIYSVCHLVWGLGSEILLWQIRKRYVNGIGHIIFCRCQRFNSLWYQSISKTQNIMRMV